MDTDGQFPTIIIGAVIGAVITGGVELYTQVKENGWENVDVAKVAIKTGEGALSGALMGSGVGLAGAIGGNAAISATSSVASDLLDRSRGEDIGTDVIIINAVTNGVIGAGAGWVGGAGVKAPVKFKSITITNVVFGMKETTTRLMEPTSEAVIKSMITGTVKMLITNLATNRPENKEKECDIE